MSILDVLKEHEQSTEEPADEEYIERLLQCARAYRIAIETACSSRDHDKALHDLKEAALSFPLE